MSRPRVLEHFYLVLISPPSCENSLFYFDIGQPPAEVISAVFCFQFQSFQNKVENFLKKAVKSELNKVIGTKASQLSLCTRHTSHETEKKTEFGPNARGSEEATLTATVMI